MTAGPTRMKNAGLSLFFFLALAVAALPVSSRVMIPHALQGPTQYMEIVREKKGCTKDCFVEYFLLSNGRAIRTHIDTTDYEHAAPSIDTRDIGAAAAEKILASAAGFFKTPRETSARLVDPDNIYYYDGEAYHAWSSPEPAIKEFLDVFGEVDTAYAAAQPSDSFYLHEYYQPLEGATHSLHVFDDGTLVVSLFDKSSYRMTGTSISGLNGESTAKTKELATKAAAAKPVGYVKCPPSSGIEYGVVEFVIGSQVQKSNTCSTESGDIAALFNFVRKVSSGE